MKPFSRLVLTGALALSFVVAHAQGGTITQTLGEQDFFVDSAFVSASEFQSAALGSGPGGLEPFPFNRLIGNDTPTSPLAPGDMDTSFTFNYGVVSDPISQVILTISLWDSDSAQFGSQLASFVLNGTIDLTEVLNSRMEAEPGLDNQVRIHNFNLPSSAFASIASGTATFQLVLKGPGLGLNGASTQFNGGGLDFARIDILTRDAEPPPAVAPIPEPSTAMLLGVGLFAGVLFRRKNGSKSPV
jgi:hypothetical protein